MKPTLKTLVSMYNFSKLKILFFTVLLFAACQNNSKKNPVNNAKYKENLIKANKALVDVDQERIASFVKRRNWDMQVSETGLWYEIYEPGTGEKAQENKVAHLKYTISLLDGTLCYTSDSLGEMQFKIGSGGVESGLEEAILMMHAGAKGRFIMMPHLAHGLLGDANKIPPRSTIVYQAELLKLTDF